MAKSKTVVKRELHKDYKCAKFVSLQEEVKPSLTVEPTQTTVTLSQRTDAVGLGLDLVLEHHGCDKIVREQLQKQLHSYLDSSLDEGVWLKRAKYALTYPLSKYLRNPLPAAPDLVFLPSGSLRRWMKTRLCIFNRKNTHLWYSWFQSKRSSLPASSDIIEATYTKHLETLTRVDPGDPETIGQIMDLPIFQRLLKRLKRTVASYLKKIDSFEERAASGSACFENSRKKKGQQGCLATLCEADLSDTPSSTVWTDDLWSMRYYPKVFGKKGVHANVVAEQRVRGGWEQWNSLRVLRDDQVFFSSFQEPNCTIQGILEPMKVRVISKGNALPYYSCKPLQVAMHSSMRDMDCFRLIGRPLSPTDFMDLAENSSPTDHWFSVDYSAATDGLSWKYSGQIFKKIIEDLPEDMKILAGAVLGPHNLHYPVAGRSEVVFKGVQQNGQLMGSILSFPILCLANLGVYLLATNEVQFNWSDKARLRHVLINGDDMVYAAPPSLWERHVNIAAKVGLEMSVGKAYSHPVYANINSTSIHYDLRKVNSNPVTVEEFLASKPTKETPWQIDFLNSGLFYGKNKVQEADSEKSKQLLEPREEGDLVTDGPWDIPGVNPKRISRLLSAIGINSMDETTNLVSTLNEVLRGALPGKHKQLLMQFLSLHKAKIYQECLAIRVVGGDLKIFTRNLFLPISIGGMGVVPPVNFKFTVKKVQQSIAYDIVERGSCMKRFDINSQYPLKGYPINEVDDKVSVPWSRDIADQIVFQSRVDSLSSKIGMKYIRGFQGIASYANRSTYMKLSL